jgi:hypothetical protein
MLAQAEGQAKADGIYELGSLHYQITAPNNGPEVVLDNLGKHAGVLSRAPKNKTLLLKI